MSSDTPLTDIAQPVAQLIVIFETKAPTVLIWNKDNKQWSSVITIYTAQWSLYVPLSDHYIYRSVITICTAQWSLYVPLSDHYIYRSVVTICTAQWSLYVPLSGHYIYHQFHIPTFCPHSVFMFFLWIWGETATISKYSIIWLAFITGI